MRRRSVLGRLIASPPSAAGLVGAALLVLLAAVGPWILPYPVDAGQIIRDGRPRLAPPSLAHPFGTDWFGLDVLSRVILGARPTIAIGLASALLTVVIGVLVGVTSGYLGGLYDGLWMRFIDVVMAFPSLLLAILIAATMEPGFATVFLALVCVGWAGTARLVRSMVLSMRRQEYVLAAVTLGAGTGRILARHILPNVMPTLIVVFSSRIGSMVLAEASLSFLGLGAPEGAASWGVMVNYGMDHMSGGPWCSLFPASAIALTVMAFNFLGDGMRDALDPRLRTEM